MGRDWAITIGINGYRNLQRLNYAKRDAEAMRDFCQEELNNVQTVYHFSDDSPPIPTDFGPPLDSTPTYASLHRFLRVRFEKPFLQPGDNLWFFFAGHGKRYEERDYLMPIDADPGDELRQSTWIPLSYITERLRRSGADNVIMIIDACRSGEGRRDSSGFGQEQQQGVIALFACSPWQSSYEIEQLEHGVFTYSLLEGLRLEGEGNCATVERLYNRLQYRVPQLTQEYKREKQTPYGTIEPPTKYHLILLPRKANVSDIVTLKEDAVQSEKKQNYELAKQLWIRVLAVSPADGEAIEATKSESSRSQPKGRACFVITGSMDSMTENMVKAMTEHLRKLTGDADLTILKVEEGSIKLTFEGSQNSLDLLANLVESGELTELLGFPIEDFQILTNEVGLGNVSLRDANLSGAGAVANNSWMQSLQSFQHRLQEGWKRQAALLGKFTHQLNFDSSKEFDFLLHAEAASIRVNPINKFIELLDSGNADVSFRAALELGDSGSTKPEVIAALVKRLETTQDLNTLWQISLSLGKLQPDHPKAAIAQNKEVQLAKQKLGLIVALKRGEDDLVDVLLQLYSPDDDYLPVGLEIVLLSEAGKKIRQEDGETFVEATVKAEELYLNLYAFGTPGERFTIKLSLGDASTTETFTL